METKRQLAHALREEADHSGETLRAGLLKVAWQLATCGGTPMPGTPEVVIRQSVVNDRRTVSGMLHCSRHLCPKCGTFNASRRREALLEVLPQVIEAGRHFHVVLTLRHRAGVKWKELALVFRKVWRKMQQSIAWKGRKAGVRVDAIPKPALGFVRADEVTYGANGFHHHIHLLLTLRNDVDVEEFKAWFAAFWERHARAEGRTADWSSQHGWWSEIAPEKLRDAVLYGTKNADPGTPDLAQEAQQELGHVLAGEIMGGTAKDESAPWSLPTLAFYEVWQESKGHRWFATGGIWRTKLTAQLETDEEANEEREDDGEPIASVLVWKWKALPGELRDWVLGLVHNQDVSRAEFLKWWWGFWRAWDAQNPHLRPPDEEPPPKMPEAA